MQDINNNKKQYIKYNINKTTSPRVYEFRFRWSQCSCRKQSLYINALVILNVFSIITSISFLTVVMLMKSLTIRLQDVKDKGNSIQALNILFSRLILIIQKINIVLRGNPSNPTFKWLDSVVKYIWLISNWF